LLSPYTLLLIDAGRARNKIGSETLSLFQRVRRNSCIDNDGYDHKHQHVDYQFRKIRKRTGNYGRLKRHVGNC